MQLLPKPLGPATPEVTLEARLAGVLVGEMTRQQLQQALGLKDDDHFRKAHLQPALDAGLIEISWRPQTLVCCTVAPAVT